MVGWPSSDCQGAIRALAFDDEHHATLRQPRCNLEDRDRHELFCHVERNSSDLASAGPTQRLAMI